MMKINNVILSNNGGFSSTIEVESPSLGNSSLRFILPKEVSKPRFGGSSMSVDDSKVVINGFKVKLIDKNTLQFKKGSVKYLSYADSKSFERVGKESMLKKLVKLFS